MRRKGKPLAWPLWAHFTTMVIWGVPIAVAWTLNGHL